MSRFSRIEEEAMRNVMHTIEWKSDVKSRQDGADYDVDIYCTIDGDKIDFDILNDTSKKYILDMIFNNKINEGEFVEVTPEPIENEDV